jgi:uncharacterized protein (AIM24 family)
LKLKLQRALAVGFFKKLKVTVLGGQSFFVNSYIAHEDNCFIGLTGPPIGDIVRMSINAENGLIVHSGTYIASSTGIMLDTEWQGFKKGIFGSGLFIDRQITFLLLEFWLVDSSYCCFDPVLHSTRY